MTKEELRKHFRKKRGELTPEQVDSLSRQIAGNFDLLMHRLSKPVEFLHVFLPIRKKQEVDTWHIIDHIHDHEPEKKIVVSRSDFQNRTMEHFLLEKDAPLELNSLDIPEPVSGERIDESKIDMVILPLLAFDEKGDRVGYGAGFYDMFLSNCRKDVIKAGVSFFEPVDRIKDTEDHDIVLDHCVTPYHIHSFGG